MKKICLLIIVMIFTTFMNSCTACNKAEVVSVDETENIDVNEITGENNMNTEHAHDVNATYDMVGEIEDKAYYSIDLFLGLLEVFTEEQYETIHIKLFYLFETIYKSKINNYISEEYVKECEAKLINYFSNLDYEALYAKAAPVPIEMKCYVYLKEDSIQILDISTSFTIIAIIDEKVEVEYYVTIGNDDLDIVVE